MSFEIETTYSHFNTKLLIDKNSLEEEYIVQKCHSNI